MHYDHHHDDDENTKQEYRNSYEKVLNTEWDKIDRIDKKLKETVR